MTPLLRHIFIAAAALLAAVCAAPLDARAQSAARETAIFAGGCFWCTEADFEKVPGVISAVSGYTGGPERNPTYQQVVAGRTRHVEAVKVTYDPRRVSYRQLVDHFWRTIDPTDADGQFCDRGASYTTGVFVSGREQRREAEASRAAARQALGRNIVTPIRDAGTFWPAETYHQDYYKKNPLRYRTYREGCRRDARLRAVWGTP